MFQLGIPGCRLRIPTYLYSICWKPSTSHLIPNMWVWLQSLNVLRSLLKLKACPKYSKMYRRLIFPNILVHSVDIYGRMAAAAKKSRPRSKCHYEQKLGLKVANFSSVGLQLNSWIQPQVPNVKSPLFEVFLEYTPTFWEMFLIDPYPKIHFEKKNPGLLSSGYIERNFCCFWNWICS